MSCKAITWEAKTLRARRTVSWILILTFQNFLYLCILRSWELYSLNLWILSTADIALVSFVRICLFLCYAFSIGVDDFLTRYNCLCWSAELTGVVMSPSVRLNKSKRARLSILSCSHFLHLLTSCEATSCVTINPAVINKHICKWAEIF